MKKRRAFLLYYITVLFFLVITLIPFIWAIIVSLTPEFEMFKNTKAFLPNSLIFDNYKSLFDLTNRDSKIFFNGIMNSIKTVLITISLCLPCAILSAYAISRIEFKGKNIIKLILLSTMAIPVLATIIPLYKVFANLGFLDNLFFLSLVYVTSFLPINTWILSNYFDTIPTEIEDAGYLDGCNKITVLFRIIIPLSYQAIFSSFLLLFLMTWSQFQIPLILASSYSTKPISIVVSEFVSKDTIKYGLTTASGLLAVLPVTFIAIVFNRFIIRGITGNYGK